MADVFISYSHKDSNFAHSLADELRRRQIDVWIDQRIDYGDRWPQVIQENLSACRVFILVMSDTAYNSKWVQNEVSYAQAKHKTIFPLLLDGEVWLSTASTQYVDVRSGEMPPDKFFENLKRELNDPRTRPQRMQPHQPAVIKPPMQKKLVHKNRWGPYVTISFVLCILLSGSFFLAWWLKTQFFPSIQPTSPATTPVPTATIPTTSTPGFNTGVITYIAHKDDRDVLYVLDDTGNAHPLIDEPGITSLEVLSISPFPDGEITSRYLVASYRENDVQKVVVVNIGDASDTTPILEGVGRISAQYLSNGQLFIVLYKNDQAEYYLYATDGSNPNLTPTPQYTSPLFPPTPVITDTLESTP